MTREEWLLEAIEILRSDIQHIAPLPQDVLVLDDWPGDITPEEKCYTIGTCTEAHGYSGIFVAPRINDNIEVLEILVHELIHVSIGNDHGHDDLFAITAGRIGLRTQAGKMTSTMATPKLRTRLSEISNMLGTYPGVLV